MTAPVVILAVGNPSRGDDAIGPLLCERLADWLQAEGLADCFGLIEDFQLNIEHALDLVGRELVLFIDAGEGTRAPFCFQRIFPVAGMAHCSHELAPEAVLEVFRRTLHQEPPAAFVLCVRGEAFELGEPLSRAAQENVEGAWACLQQLFRHPDRDSWEGPATP